MAVAATTSISPATSCLNGIRCLCCLWIIFVHTHFYSALFPWSEPSMKYIREFPVLGFFATSSLAVDIFWMISGFLCEYQLQYKVDKSVRLWPLWFMINRLLRLYPLYLLNTLFFFLNPGKCNKLSQVFRSIFFIEFCYNDCNNGLVHMNPCSAMGWSIQTDIHGYVVLILLIIIINNSHNRYYILCSFFLISCIISIYIAFTYNISWPILVFGLDSIPPELIELYDTNNFINPLNYYPDFDHLTPTRIQSRKTDAVWLCQLYFSSILKHGSSMFLGAILAINVTYDHNNKKKYIKYKYQIIKLLISFVLFYIIMDLRMDIEYRSPIWTVIYTKIYCCAMFLLLNVILSIHQYNDNIFSVFIKYTLSNKIFIFFSKFTYAIYLFHGIPLFLLIQSNHPIYNSKQNEYGFIYLGKIFVIASCIILIISIICHYLFEYPITLIRYKFLQPKYIKKYHQKIQ